MKNRKNRILYFTAAFAAAVSMMFANIVPAAAEEYAAEDSESVSDNEDGTYDYNDEESGTYDYDDEDYESYDSQDEYDESYDSAGEDYDADIWEEASEYDDYESYEDDADEIVTYEAEEPEVPDDPDEDDVLGVIASDDPIETEEEEEVEAENAHTLVYMSDLEPVYASIGWGSLMRDENPENGEISLRVNGVVTGFKKGVAAHAESTLIYNVTELYEQGYRYFQTYYGVNSTKAGSVKFYMYTTADESWDGAEWTTVEGVDSSVKSGSSAAGYIEIPLTEDMTYLKLYADPDGGNGQDHSVYGGAKFITDAYYHDDVMTVAEYDEKIREYYEQYGTDLWSDTEYEQLVLERDLVNKVGYDVLQSRFNDEDGESYKEMIEWLFDNPSFLKMYLTGDEPGGNYLAGTYSYSGSSYDSYSSSLETMYKLWKTHREDFDGSSVYQKMICAVSLSLTGSVKFWYGTSGGTADTSITQPNPVERYEIYKSMYQGGYLLTSYFDQLYVPEMRYIMGSSIHNNEIEWGANMALERNYNTNCYSWMYYQYGTFNYFQDKFYNSETWGSDPAYDYVSRYNLSTYGITNYGYGSSTDVKYPMNWMGMVDGGTCWPIANLCQNIWSSYGRPCYICGCWGGSHEVYMAYNWYEGSDNSGRSGYGRWTVENGLGVAWQDVNYGAYDSTGWHIARLLGGWGTNSDSRYTNASYVILGQSAMNDYYNYVRAEELEMLSRVFSGDEAVQESIYWAMLDWEGFHYDAWRGLVKLYAASGSKSDEDKYNLAERMMSKSALYYYPIPLDDLLSILTNSMGSATYISMVQNSEQETLRAASQTTDGEFYSAYAVQQVANGLLGTGDSVVGSFSFDGENAGKIILNQEKFPHPEYWEYSLDGGNTWSEVIHDSEVHDAEGLEEIEGLDGITTFSQMVVENTNVVQLTPEEIAQVNTTDNILIRFIQVPDYIYTIYITQSGTPVIGSTYNVTGVYLNPWENQAVYVTDTMEWRYSGDESSSWTSFASAQPDRNLGSTIDVRYTASGTTTAGDYATVSYDNNDNNYKQEEGYDYIPISRLTLYDYTAQANDTRAVKYALDGSIYSFYQSVTTTDYPIYITLQLDSPMYLDKLEYQCNLGNTANGQIKQARVLVSTDGENWTEVEYLDGTDGYDSYASGASTYLSWGTGNSAAGKTPKQVYFTPVNAQYIRLEAYSCESNFMSVGDLRVFADTALTDEGGEAGNTEVEGSGDTEVEDVGGTEGAGSDGTEGVTTDGTEGTGSDDVESGAAGGSVQGEITDSDAGGGTASSASDEDNGGTSDGTAGDVSGSAAGDLSGGTASDAGGGTASSASDEDNGGTSGSAAGDLSGGTAGDVNGGSNSDGNPVGTDKLGDIVVDGGSSADGNSSGEDLSTGTDVSDDNNSSTGRSAASDSEGAEYDANADTSDNSNDNTNVSTDDSVTGSITDAEDGDTADVSGAEGAGTGDTNVPVILIIVIIICAAAIVVALVLIRTGRRSRK